MKKVIKFLIPALVAAVTVYLVGVSGVREEDSATVPTEQDYYVGVQLVEVTATDKDGESWDSFNDSGPDLYVVFHWQGVKVFKSSAKEDSLIAHWSEAEFDLRDYALQGKPTSIDDVIAGARVRISETEPLTITLYEKDLLKDDLIASFDIDLTKLTEGTHTITDPAPSVKRVVLRVLPFSALPSLFGEKKE